TVKQTENKSTSQKSDQKGANEIGIERFGKSKPDHQKNAVREVLAARDHRRWNSNGISLSLERHPMQFSTLKCSSSTALWLVSPSDPDN
ncbi:hypothetical protein TYRP_011008, partial [Tyrophagus putrescentiae]